MFWYCSPESVKHEAIMATINDGELYLMVKGASEDDIRRGLMAARAVFEESGVTVADALAALEDREAMFGNPNPPPLTDEHVRRVEVFDKAAQAAIDAVGIEPGTVTDFGSYAEHLAFYEDDEDFEDEELPDGPHYSFADPRQAALVH